MSIVIFSKFLTKTDIESRLTVPTNVPEHINMPEGDMPGARLAVPTHALEHFNMPVGANYVNLSPTDSDGKECSFRCYTRLHGHPKPIFATDWLNFVRGKGLQIGDKGTFSKLEDEAGGAPQGEQNMVDLPQQIVG